MWTQKSQFYILRKPKSEFWVYIRIVKNKYELRGINSELWEKRSKLWEKKIKFTFLFYYIFFFYVAETCFHIIQYKCIKYRVTCFRLFSAIWHIYYKNVSFSGNHYTDQNFIYGLSPCAKLISKTQLAVYHVWIPLMSSNWACVQQLL